MARALEDLFGRSEMIQQFLADFAEQNKEAATGFTAAVKRVLAKLREFFEKLMRGTASRTEEARIIRECGTDVIDGLLAQYEKTFMAALEGNAARNATGEFEQGGMRYSLNENAATELHKALYDTAYLEEVLLRDESPAIMLAQKGVKNLPMAMNASHIRENVFSEDEARNLGLRVDSHTHYHGLGEAFFLQIIDGLDSVTEAYRGTKNASNSARRENYFLLVSTFKDKDGNVINVPVYIDEHAHFNRVFVDVNKISTAFGRTDFYDYIKRQIEKGNLVRIKYRSISTSEPDALIAPRYGRNASAISIAQKPEKSTPDAKNFLEDRVSGDDLLNARDLISDVQELSGQVDEYGYITLYHRTSAEKAAAIRSSGEMIAKENGLFFSTKIDGQNVGYGDTVVTFSIPAEKLLLDDVFDDEAHLRFPLKKPGRVSVKEYLVSESAVDVGLHSDPEDDEMFDHRYSYNLLIQKPDMPLATVVQQSSYNRDNVIDQAFSNLKSVGRVDDRNNVMVYVEDVGTEIMVPKKSLKHGFDRRVSVLAPVYEKIGEVLQQSIRINELVPRSENVDHSYVLVGAAVNKNNEKYIVCFVVNGYSHKVSKIDVVYSTNAKKEPAALLPKFTGNPATPTDSTISISRLLEYVNQYFPDILPESVLRHFGHQKRPEGRIGESALFSDPEDEERSDREILAAVLLDDVSNEEEYVALKAYQAKIRSLDKKSEAVTQLTREINELRFQKGKRTPEYYEKLDALIKKRNELDREIRRADNAILKLSKPLQELVIREKRRTKELWRAKGEQAMAAYREKNLSRIYIQKIEEKAKKLRRMLVENSEQYHIPDAFKAPVSSFLSLLDFSSERALQGGELTKKDMELQAAFDEVVTMLKSLTDENSNEYLSGLDLPPDAVDEFVALSKEVTQMAVEGRESGTMVLRRMTAEQLKTLNTTLYAMTRAVRQANDLFANERFRHVSDLAEESITEFEQYAARKLTGKLSDFLGWENLTPYYAFARLGSAGLSLFDGFREGQSRFAFLTEEITAFTEKLYTDKEVKAWEREVHTFKGERGEFYMTTAQIMTLLELWGDEDAKKHLLGGGARIEDISVYRKGKKEKYTNDTNGTPLSEGLVNSIFAKLTDRQREVASALQKFMAERCAEWGNEVSYRRWGIKLFGLDYYFPIESDKNTMSSDIEQAAKETGLFTLLHKSFTKKRVFRANNRIMIHSIFNVFAAHATDMAKYNAFALPLLDMQKYINYKAFVSEEQETKPIDLSVDNELSARIGNIHGAQRYKAIAKYIREVLGNENIKLSDGRLAIVDNSDALHIANGAAPKKAAKIAKIKEIVQQAKLYAQDATPTHNKFDFFYYYKLNVSLGGETFPVYLNVGRAKNDGKFHIYDITNKIRDTADRINGLERPVGNALKNGVPTNSIADPNAVVKMGTSAAGEENKAFRTRELRTSMEKAFGKAAYGYIKQFLIDLNGSMGGRSAAESLLQKGITAHKIAAVGANLRVALLQPTAYVRALNVLEPKYFLGGLRVGGHLKA